MMTETQIKMSKNIKAKSILWIKAQDQFYYDYKTMFDLLKSDYGEAIDIIFYPQDSEIVSAIKERQKRDIKPVFLAI